MDKPVAVKRHLIKLLTIGPHVSADFGFSADFRSAALTLGVTLSVEADKTASLQGIEQMADKMFLDVLKATLAKSSEEISPT